MKAISFKALQMESGNKTYFEDTKDLMASYVEDRMLLIKMEIAEKAAEASASIFKGIVVALLLFFVLMIVTFLAGYYLSQLTGSILLGFGTLAIVYILLVFLLLYLHKKYFNNYIVDKVIAMFFNNKNAL